MARQREQRERKQWFSAAMWNDPVFTGVSPRAQWTVFFLSTQFSINRAGVIGVTMKRWARMSKGSVEEQLRSGLAELEEAGLAAMDWDTEELLIRKYMRDDEVVRQPNVLKAALRQAGEVHSPALRAVLAGELRLLDNTDADAVADRLSEGFGNPSGTLPEGFPEPFPNPSGTLPDSNPSGTLPEGFREPRGEGEGESSAVGSSFVGTYVGDSSHAKIAHARGRRLPVDFSMTDDMRVWAQAKAPRLDLEYETERFRNYWAGRSGKAAVKLDWVATWRNWMLKEARDSSAPRLRAVSGGHTPYRDPDSDDAYDEDPYS